MSPVSPQLGTIVPYIDTIHTFVNQLYGIYDKELFANDACIILLHKGEPFDQLSPSNDSLQQDVLRSTYQEGHVWCNQLPEEPSLPNVTNWRGKKHIPEYAPVPG